MSTTCSASQLATKVSLFDYLKMSLISLRVWKIVLLGVDFLVDKFSFFQAFRYAFPVSAGHYCFWKKRAVNYNCSSVYDVLFFSGRFQDYLFLWFSAVCACSVKLLVSKLMPFHCFLLLPFPFCSWAHVVNFSFQLLWFSGLKFLILKKYTFHISVEIPSLFFTGTIFTFNFWTCMSIIPILKSVYLQLISNDCFLLLFWLWVIFFCLVIFLVENWKCQYIVATLSYLYSSKDYCFLN